MGDGASRADLLRRGDRPAGAARERAWTRSPASARRCRSRPRRWCWTTARATARPSSPARIRRSTRRSRWRAGPARVPTTRSCWRARTGRYALLLNEDSELRPGATIALWRALQEHPRAALAGARLLDPERTPQPCAWRFPSPAGARRRARAAAAAGRAEPRPSRSARSTGASPRRCSSAARPPPRWTTWTPSSSSTPTRSTSPGGCATRAGTACTSPRRRPSTTSSSPTTPSAAAPRIVELARNRDLYMRKHHSPAAARAVRWLTALGYAVRALLACLLPGHSPRRYWAARSATLDPAAARACARRPNASTRRCRRTPTRRRRARGPELVRGERGRRCRRTPTRPRRASNPADPPRRARRAALTRRAAGPRRRPRGRRGRRGSRPPAGGRRRAARARRRARGVRRSASAAATPAQREPSHAQRRARRGPRSAAAARRRRRSPPSSRGQLASRRHWKATVKSLRVSSVHHDQHRHVCAAQRHSGALAAEPRPGGGDQHAAAATTLTARPAGRRRGSCAR